jgi:tetratricopeptide (TPR) repeat protein
MADTVARIVLSAVDQASGQLNKVSTSLGKLKAEALGIGSAFGGLGAQVASALSLGAMAAFVMNTTRGVDALNDLGDATGASIENLSALEDVAARTGTSFEAVGQSLIKLNQALNTAKGGDDVSAVFTKLGLSLEELKRIDPAEALLKTAQAFDRFAADGSRARAEQLLFGRSLKDIAPLLKDIAEAGGLNATVTTQQALAAEQFNNALLSLQKNAKDAARGLLFDLLPALNDFLVRLQAANKEWGGFIKGFFTAANNNWEDAGAGVAHYTKKLAELDALIARRPTIGRRSSAEFFADERKELEKLLDFYKTVYAKTAPDLGQSDPRELARRGRGPATPQVSMGNVAGTGGSIKAVVSEYDKYVEKLRETLRGTQDLSVAEQLRVDIAEGKIKDLTAAGRVYLEQLADIIDLAKKPAEFVGPEIDAALLAQRDQQAKELRSLIEGSKSAQFDRLVSQTQELIRWQEEGQITAKQYAQGIEGIGAAFEGLRPKIEEATTFAEQASKNIQDALGDTLTRVLDGDFKNIGQLWSDMLRKMVAQALAANLNQYLFGSGIGSGGGLLGGVLGSLFGSTPGRAAGGPVSAGRAYLVGERGPEIMVPSSSGRIVPNGMGVTVNQTLNIGQGVSRAEVYAGALQAKNAAVAEIVQMMRRGASPA